MRSGPARAVVIAGNAESGASKLAGEGVSARCSRKRFDEVENCDGESLGADLQVFCGPIHTIVSSTFCSDAFFLLSLCFSFYF